MTTLTANHIDLEDFLADRRQAASIHFLWGLELVIENSPKSKEDVRVTCRMDAFFEGFQQSLLRRDGCEFAFQANVVFYTDRWLLQGTSDEIAEVLRQVGDQ